jgi:MerR family regulatory protein
MRRWMSMLMPYAKTCSGCSFKMFFDMSKAPTELTIGALSEQTGVNVETIRYYEREGLLPSAPRTAGSHRVSDEVHLRRLIFIRRSRGLGFSGTGGADAFGPRGRRLHLR